MWSLIDNNGRETMLEKGKVITVGRRNTDILLENDNSISKLHAKITVLQSEDPEYQNEVECIIMDAGSKYGSFIIGPDNELESITKIGHHCKPQEKVRFGLQQHLFTLKYSSSYKYRSLLSRIYDDEKDELFKILKKINGILYKEWDPQCNYITCPTVTLTEKVLCALVAGLHIVTKEYWYALVDALGKRSGTLPNPEDFTPKVDSSILVTDEMSLLPNPSRKSLFKEKIFIFFNKDQYRLYSRMIELGGGTSIMYDEPWKPQDCCESNAVVVQLMDPSQSTQLVTQQLRSVCLRLSREKLRSIPETEIPLAILYCSMEQYCNPRYKYDILLQPNERDPMTETAGDILAADTQIPRFSNPSNKQRKQIIPESVPIDTQMSSQMQSQMSLKTRKHTSSIVAKSKIIREKVIIPETPSLDTQTSSRTQSQLSSNTTKRNSGESEMEPSKNGKKNFKKPRVIEMETVIPSLFETRSQKKRRLDDDRREIPEPNHPNDELIDADDSDLESPEKTQPRHANKSRLNNISKKRQMEIHPPVLPDSNATNEALFAKKRKRNRNDDSNVIQLPEIVPIELAPRKNTVVACGNNSGSSNDGPSHIDSNVDHAPLPHYFSRNNIDRPKCIIPKRLTLDDFYVWKPSRQS